MTLAISLTIEKNVSKLCLESKITIYTIYYILLFLILYLNFYILLFYSKNLNKME